MQAPKSVSRIFSRHFSSPIMFAKIPSKYRPRAIEEAQQAITEYLHYTRSVPFTYAEHISKNSSNTLSELISHAGFPFSATNFSHSFHRFLRYHPINEFAFFFESIGIDYAEVSRFLPANKFFFSEHLCVLEAACALSGFGFPWNKLGKLCEEEVSIFSKCPKDLKARLCGFKNDYGFDNVTVVSVCLAFPYVLAWDGEYNREIAGLFDDLKTFFVDFDLVSCVEGNVDAWYNICRKIRVFYDLGCQKGKLGELMGRNKSLFLDYSEEALVQKVEYFCRFGVSKEDVGLFLLKSPGILSFDLETRVISVERLLKHFGLGAEKLKSVAEKYPYVLGRNKMANLPHVMRAANLEYWFFNEITNGNYQKLENYALSNPDEDLDKEFGDGLERIQSSRTPNHTMNKLMFLHEIGHGENALTIKVLAHLHGTKSELGERFDCLLHNGIEFSDLCRMVRLTPKILNQNPDTIEQKLNFLRQEMGATVDYLNSFPTFLCFDLEYRIKPRYKFHTWLIEKGLSAKNYSIASMVATSEKSFIARIYGIHPAAPKQWFEHFFCKRPNNSC
ncbi:putative Mitochondrial transcription termination factor family protein [Melia azedarach]|uniref:Mitochondrial transcription termination factor family protein n=1 Tax=Melia azedarach TaxID=155640 RepID=A0ACC1YUU3_MELAZ|nr:putative Mitochondrial transcription termination factor family protein [Melia azedarach]